MEDEKKTIFFSIARHFETLRNTANPWEHLLKDKSYANHPVMIEVLKHEIEVIIHGIETQTIENVLKNWAVFWMILCFRLKWKGSTFLKKPYFWKNIHKFFFIADSNSKY